MVELSILKPGLPPKGMYVLAYPKNKRSSAATAITWNDLCDPYLNIPSIKRHPHRVAVFFYSTVQLSTMLQDAYLCRVTDKVLFWKRHLKTFSEANPFIGWYLAKSAKWVSTYSSAKVVDKFIRLCFIPKQNQSYTLY